MNTDKQNIAIAQACGVVSKDHWSHLYKTEQGYARDCPDYLNDLNAMHEAENVLPAGQWDRYAQWLRELTSSNRRFLIAHATASQRAEAFLRTIGKWEEGK